MPSNSPNVLAVKAIFDGKQILLPEGLETALPGEVIVIFGNVGAGAERAAWQAAQQAAFAKAWDNAEDEIYDRL